LGTQAGKLRAGEIARISLSLDPEAQTAGDAEITTMKTKHASRFFLPPFLFCKTEFVIVFVKPV
jgi:hypothetical protein